MKKYSYSKTPKYYSEGYKAAYAHIAWNGRIEDGADVESIACESADMRYIPDGEPRERFVRGFVDYVGTH